MLITILRHIITHFRLGLWHLELIFSIMWSHIENMIDIAYCICNTQRLRPSGELEWHYDDITISLMTSQITSLTLVYSTVYADTDQRNIKAPRHWRFCGKFTGDRWIPRINCQLRWKCFHLMTSSWFPESLSSACKVWTKLSFRCLIWVESAYQLCCVSD